MNRRIAALIWKELLGILRDPRIRFSLLMPPVVQLCIFTFAATLDVLNVTTGILNRDNGEQAFELVQRFHGSPFFPHITYLKGVEEIAPFLDKQKGVMVVSIDPQFSRNLDAGREAEVQLILDGRKSNSTQIVAGYANRIIETFNNDFTAKAGIYQQNAALVPRNWFNPNLLYYWFNIPSLVATLSMLTCLTITSISVARERELGTFDQLLVSPLSPLDILIGKVVPGILVGFFEGLLLMTVGVLLFRVPFTGSLGLMMLSILVFVASMSGIGLFVSSLSKTQQQAMLGTFLVVVPFVLLSGFATPVENMPSWLQPVSNFIPMKYMLVISKGIFLKAMPAHIVLNNLWPMAVIGVFTQVGASLFFRRRLE